MRKYRWIAPIIFGLVLLVLWTFFTSTNVIGEYVLPSPQSILARLLSGLNEGYLVNSLSQTLMEAALGCLIAALIGIPLGFAIAHFAVFGATVEPYLAASQAIPAVAVAPLLVSWIGYGSAPIIALCAIMVVFPIIVNTAVGVRSLNQDLIGAARLDGCSGWNLVLKIELPLAAPSIMAGLRTGFTLAMTGAVVGEMVIGGQRGLGIELVTAQHLNDTPAMFATIALLSIVAVGLYLTLRAAEIRVVRAVAER
ncbi:ABC transporter permease [Arcanobacterium pluranimalium]|uniref:ABC transporter permease n=1 Tax=Arcanobacterium pluranimalium TaxID=108028 RepID=UPI001958E764|nr:ABC transporter permease [Arcanobacterium pluranimalium]